ncbi:hypothetical protein [Zavarzinia aquatilis]|uniref:hypothetical protein n=1 Tax=Zavarzinia aquatilis TaxID=2211142 RepID=UPI00105827C6|nr:hypothetical protein [Zavarzinia aquatilis]
MTSNRNEKPTEAAIAAIEAVVEKLARACLDAAYVHRAAVEAAQDMGVASALALLEAERAHHSARRVMHGACLCLVAVKAGEESRSSEAQENEAERNGQMRAVIWSPMSSTKGGQAALAQQRNLVDRALQRVKCARRRSIESLAEEAKSPDQGRSA